MDWTERTNGVRVSREKRGGLKGTYGSRFSQIKGGEEIKKKIFSGRGAVVKTPWGGVAGVQTYERGEVDWDRTKLPTNMVRVFRWKKGDAPRRNQKDAIFFNGKLFNTPY